MFIFKKIVFAALVGFLAGGGLFADDLMDTYFNGNDLNSRINRYINNVSALIPDITTQDIWAYTPGAFGGNFWFGGGLNGSIAFLDRSQVSGLLQGVEAFGADNLDLAQFPDGIPFLPGVSFNLKGGGKNIDVGLTGMWLDENLLTEYVGESFIGEGSSFALRSLGLEIRYRVLKEGVLIPSVTVIAGYFYTMHNFGIAAQDANKRESVKVEFRNDTYLIGVQIAKDKLLPLIAPYAGFKMMISKTDSEYEWVTSRPVMIGDSPFLSGAKYVSASNIGSVDFYSQIYAGVGINFSVDGFSNYMLTIGGAYTLGTNHFSINAAFRYLMGG